MVKRKKKKNKCVVVKKKANEFPTREYTWNHYWWYEYNSQTNIHTHTYELIHHKYNKRYEIEKKSKNKKKKNSMNSKNSQTF